MPSLPYSQDLAECFAGRIGPAGLDDKALRPLLDAALPAIGRIAEKRDSGELPLFALPGRRDDLQQLQTIADDWRRRFARVVLFGIGGSSLGAQALAALVPEAQLVLAVPDNLDPGLMARTLDPAKLDGTGFLVVSKSGGTAETMAQALSAVAAVERTLGADAVQGNFLAIVEPGASPLRRLAGRFGWPVLDHDPNIGGRYSVLSLVGMLPALMLGVDAAGVRQGAAAVLDQALTANDAADVPAAAGAALSVAFTRAHDVRQSVLLAYVEALAPFTRWYRQLWAESLGKGGAGTTPIDALGPVDQHSQLQLWLDGPNDKLFTVLMATPQGRGPAVDVALAKEIGIDYLAGRTIGDLVAAEQRGTADALAGRGRPVRRITFDTLDAETLGALFMHFILETVIAADLLGVDPFDQPAVEDSKIRARNYLVASEARYSHDEGPG